MEFYHGQGGSALAELPKVSVSAVSPQALALFRLLERLARRTGYACVKLLETLAGMLEKSVRAVRYALAELIAAGWVRRQQTRKGGVSKLFFWPRVRVSGRSRGLFSAPPVAVCFAGYSPVALPVTPSTPNKTAPSGTGDDNTAGKAQLTPDKLQQLDPVAVSLLENVVSPHEAQELALEATAKALTKAQIELVIAAYQAQQGNIRNRGAWLREAIRRGFTPAAPVSTYASDNGNRPARVVAAPAGWEMPTPARVTPRNAPVAQSEVILGVSGELRGIERVRAVIEARRRGENGSVQTEL